MERVILLHTFKRIQPHCLVIPEYSKKTQILFGKIGDEWIQRESQFNQCSKLIMIHVWFLSES